jgi:hypothetical protein
MKKIYNLLATLIIYLMFISCNSQEFINLTVHVKEENNAPVKGFHVLINYAQNEDEVNEMNKVDFGISDENGNTTAQIPSNKKGILIVLNRKNQITFENIIPAFTEPKNTYSVIVSAE